MATFRSAGIVHTGRGSVQQLGTEARRLGARRALILTDPGVKAAGLADVGRDLLVQADVETDIFDGVQPEPPIESFEGCLAFARAGRYDVVGIGGGSSIDMAKAVAVMLTNPGSIRDYLGVDLVRMPGVPRIAVPTTAGTGSEVTPIAVVTDTARRLKIGMVTPHLIPDVAIVDPDLTVKLPPAVTAATGMDALTHAIEGYTSLRANPLSDALALDAMSRIARSLRTAVHNGADTEARLDMAVGSLLAGLAFANASVTATHAIAFALGGQFNILAGRDYEQLAGVSAVFTPPSRTFLSFPEPEVYLSEERWDFRHAIAPDALRLWRRWNRELTRAGCTYDLSDTDLPLERLSRYRVAIVPTFDFMNRGAQEKLVAFVRAGGTLVMGPAVPQLDETMRPCAILGEQITEGNRAAAVGKGRIILLPDVPSSEHPEDLLRLLGVASQIRASDPEVDVTLHKDDRRRVVYVANPTEAARRVSLLGASWLRDLWTGEELPAESVPLRPYAVRVLEIRDA